MGEGTRATRESRGSKRHCGNKKVGVGNLLIPNADRMEEGLPLSRNAYRSPAVIPIAPRIMPTATAARGERIVRP